MRTFIFLMLLLSTAMAEEKPTLKSWCMKGQTPEKDKCIPIPQPAPLYKMIPDKKEKPVCPHGIKEDWCRPLAANEKGMTNLGNKPDEE